MVATFSNLNINSLAEITFIGGTYEELVFDVYDAAGSPINISTYTLNWYLSPFGQPDTVSVLKTGTSASSSGYLNRFLVALNSEDTASLSGKYVQQPVVITSPGYEFRLAQGYINIIPAAGLSTVAQSSSFSDQIANLTSQVNSVTGSYVILSASMTVLNDYTTTSITNISGSLSVIQSEINDGWTLANETWVYLSSASITVPSGATLKYAVGDKLKFVQSGTTKYMCVVGVADTVLSVTGGSDYTVADATISSNYYSKFISPVGYPQWFNYTPMETGNRITIGSGTWASRFSITGKLLTWNYTLVWAADTSASAGTWAFSLPVKVANQLLSFGSGNVRDGATADYCLIPQLTNNATSISVFHRTWDTFNASNLTSTSPITWATGDRLDFTIAWEI